MTRRRFPDARDTHTETQRRIILSRRKLVLKPRALWYGPQYIIAQCHKFYGFRPSKRRIRREFARLRRQSK